MSLSRKEAKIDEAEKYVDVTWQKMWDILAVLAGKTREEIDADQRWDMLVLAMHKWSWAVTDEHVRCELEETLRRQAERRAEWHESCLHDPISPKPIPYEE